MLLEIDWNFKKCFENFPGTKQSYGDPQDLTEMVREVLKDKKPIADKTIDKNTSNDSDEDLKKRSKI